MKAESGYITYLLVILPRSKEAMTEAQICLTAKVCFSVCPMLPPKAKKHEGGEMAYFGEVHIFVSTVHPFSKYSNIEENCQY